MSTEDRGFASMPKEKVQEIASKGGHASHSNQHSEDDNKNHSGSKKDTVDKSETNNKSGHDAHKK